MVDPKRKCIELIARQIAIQNGQFWDRLPEAKRHGYKTLAFSILVTVERNAKVTWENRYDDGRTS